ncbi:uncharacterized protein LOC141651703 [Silene latifolia]|uniref:uncharacterized protein LOC141651703 n=1 Tax=Silene latifolia TaxID=37657 RepID=UPI003D786F3E
MKDTWSKIQPANGYRKLVVRLHGVPNNIVSDRDARFISRFCSELQDLMGTTLKMSTSFHLATDGQTERTIKPFKDMLRACVMEFHGSWEDRLDLIEDIDFQVGDKVVLKVSLMRGVISFGKRGKLSQNFIRPYEILDQIGEVAYRLALPASVDRNIELDQAATYVEMPMEILDRKLHKTRNGETILLKVLCSKHNVEEATWEPEEAMRERYPHLFDRYGCALWGRSSFLRNKDFYTTVF